MTDFIYEDAFDPDVNIKVIGVGGGGGNALNCMASSDVHDIEYIAVNTGGMYAGRGRRETPGQPSADSTPGVLHHRRRDRHIIVLPGAVGTDPVAAATLSGKAAASNANPAAHCACSRVLYGGGVVLPGTDGCAGNAALCGGGSGRRLSGISGGTVSAGAAPAETDSQYTIK